MKNFQLQKKETQVNWVVQFTVCGHASLFVDETLVPCQLSNSEVKYNKDSIEQTNYSLGELEGGRERERERCGCGVKFSKSQIEKKLDASLINHSKREGSVG